jgi:uncharacterized protein YjbJ (UPF0337 family)
MFSLHRHDLHKGNPCMGACGRRRTTWPPPRLLRVFAADVSGQLNAFQPEGFIMGAENKAANKVTEIKGKIKKEAGKATDDAHLEAEGRAEETKGDLKQAGEKVKDAFKK